MTKREACNWNIQEQAVLPLPATCKKFGDFGFTNNIKTVYLARTFADTSDELEKLIEKTVMLLSQQGVVIIDPSVQKGIKDKNADPFMCDTCHGALIGERDRILISVSNAVIVVATSQITSVNMGIEMGWAMGLGKPIFLVTNQDNPRIPKLCCGWPSFNLSKIDGIEAFKEAITTFAPKAAVKKNCCFELDEK